MKELYNFIIQQLQVNEFAIAGVIMTTLGSILYYLRTIPRTIYRSIKRRITYNVTCDQTELVYFHINDYLRDNYQYLFKNTRVVFRENFNNNEEVIVTKYEYQQYVDSFLFWYKNYPIWIDKNVEKLEGAQNIYHHEKGRYTLSTLFNKKIIDDLLNDVFNHYDNKRNKEKILRTFTYSCSSGWSIYKKSKPIPFNSIILDRNLKKDINNSIENWKSNNIKLSSKGISTTLCHLYDGAPGSGKTSTALSIAYENNMKVFYLDLNSLTSLNQLQEAIRLIHDNSMLIIEEIEDVWDGREVKNKECKIPISGLLNLLSGSLSKDNLMIVMTSNDISRLDPALIRAGRVDFRGTFTPPSKEMVKDYIQNFFNIDINIDNIKSLPPSMADLESWCIKHINNPNNIIKKITNE